MSNLLRKRRPTASGAQTGPSPSKKQRLIDATKMVLDIAKESADALPPLKSCLGGICALINHYEEYKDVEERLRDLVPWLNKLKGSATTGHPDDNPEGAERRNQLEKSLRDIERRSKELSEKCGEARFIDKKQDSGMVVKLVEELRQAILIYQLSQQRSIENQIAHLTSSFNAFLKLREKPQGVKGEVESILERLGRLKVEGSTVGDKDECKRRMILFEAFERIKDELLLISEQSSTAGYEENDADVRAVCKLAENVRDAVMEYQFARQKAAEERMVLNSYRRARGAEYQHGNRNGCLKGTRESVLDEIEQWTEDPKKSPVFWLNGLAGTGKTTIAQTIAERVFAKDQLGASFFCSRDFEDRSDLRFIFPTLAFQLAYKYSDFRSHLVDLLQKSPDVVHESLYNQMQKLIAEPLRAAGISTIIVIDALDECKDDEPSSALLSVLGRFVGQIPEAKFFITGRPEPRIRTGFRLPLLIDSTDVFVLHDVHPNLVNSDIRLFLKHELSELAQRRQLGSWPTDESIDLLCYRAAGLFVYAVATVKFLDSNTHLPKQRLGVILRLPESTAPEGKTRFNPKTTLDSLYKSILQAAFNEEDPDVDSKVRAIIGTIVTVVNPLPPRAIAELIGVELEEVMLFLTLIQSLFAIDESSNQPVKPYHKSFPDFITDPSRCADPRFLISPELLHSDLAADCLRLMNEGLERNLLSLPEYTLNSEVGDLQKRIDYRISSALRYACRSWHSHLIEIRGDITNFISHLEHFLEEKFLAWLEVLSVLGEVGGAVIALEKLMAWFQMIAPTNPLLVFFRDYFRFVTKFFEPISASATHIYHSALELCPTLSVVRRLYYDWSSRITCLPRVVVGTPDSWDPTISISGKDDYKCCTWSPCGRFIAVLTGNTIEIRNHLSFELMITLQPKETTSPLAGPLAYSPNGCSLACTSNTVIVIWDIQTGGVAKEIVCNVVTISLVWSLDGRSIAILQHVPLDSLHEGTYLYEYDVTLGTSLFAKKIDSGHPPHLLAYNDSFKVMTIEQHPLNPTKIETDFKVFEVQQPCLININTFVIENTGTSCTLKSEIAFSPTTSRVSVVMDNTLFIIDDQNQFPLLQEKGHFISPHFSPNGSLFAASKENDVYIWIWNGTSSSYVQWKQFQTQDSIDSIQFSPTSSSILTHSRNILQMRYLDNLPKSPESHCQQYAALSHTGSLIATAREQDSTITFINPHSQISSWRIDIGVPIEGLFLTSNVLLAVCPGQVVAWLLPEKGPLDCAFNYDRGVWAIQLPFDIWPSLRLSKLKPTLRVTGKIGIIEHKEVPPALYHMTTGNILQLQAPLPLSSPLNLTERLCGRHYLHCHELSQCDTTPEGGWHPSETMLQEGWVKDPEGKHRLWLQAEWRKSWDLADWCHDITTQFSIIGGQPVVVKF